MWHAERQVGADRAGDQARPTVEEGCVGYHQDPEGKGPREVFANREEATTAGEMAAG